MRKRTPQRVEMKEVRRKEEEDEYEKEMIEVD
jgi:hypothetical protein